MERLNVRRLVSDCDFKVTGRIGDVVAELGKDDTNDLVERLRAIVGNQLANEVEETINAIANAYGDAGFLVGYHTRANPEWLIFDDDTD